MQIYHVETQEDYDALMVELEGRGYLWLSNKKPNSRGNRWLRHKENFCVIIDNKMMTYADIRWCKKHYLNATIQKYKAKQNGYIEGEYYCMPNKRTLSQTINDVVNSPNHYTQGELEVIDILQDKLTPQEFEGFLKGNILKYTFREGIKNGTEDMKKGAWYMSRLIDFRKKQEG